MFTDCPGCHRQFHIYAAQLSAAKGIVKCGYCGAQFSALDRLHDQPMPVENENIPVMNEEDLAEQEPEFDIPIEKLTTEAKPVPHTEKRQDQQVVKQNAVNEEPLSTYSYTHSDMLDDEQLAKPAKTIRLFWTFSFLLLVLVAIAQVAWFQRDRLLSRYPVAIPWFQELCNHLHCQLIRYRDVSAIKLINRDVRAHPRYEGALLANVTMSNQLHTIQPFPDIQLNLFDKDGELVGHRKFLPQEYLDESFDIVSGMVPDVQIHFVLEIVGATEQAVGFEFKFL